MPVIYRNLEERIMYCTVFEPITECWTWIARIASNGYGRINMRINGKHRCLYAHRVAYEALTGASIPEGLELDHLCRNPRCVNPAHLEPVSKAENLLRRGT